MNNSHIRKAYRIRVSRGLQITGFSTGIVGIYFASCSGGLNFRISPKFSSEGSLQENMKAMIISLMMNDKLSKDEISILTNSVEAICSMDSEGESGKCVRDTWCITEIKNFMDCSTKYADFKTDRCKSYRMLLKSCLQAKKDGCSLQDPGIRFKTAPCFKNKPNTMPNATADCTPSNLADPQPCDKTNNQEKLTSPPRNPKGCEIIHIDTTCSNKTEDKGCWNAYCNESSHIHFKNASTNTTC